MNWFKKISQECKDITEEGRSVEKNIGSKDVDTDELRMGIQVEFEHTDNVDFAEKIALDHLAEAPKDAPLKYYTGLKLLERMIESLAEMDKAAANEKIEEFKKFVDDLEK